MSLARLTVALFLALFLIAGVAVPTCSIAACLESQVSGEVEQKDEVDPCPGEEFLASPGHQAGAAHAQRPHRRAPRPPALSARRAAPVAAHPQPELRPGSALPLLC